MDTKRLGLAKLLACTALSLSAAMMDAGCGAVRCRTTPTETQTQCERRLAEMRRRLKEREEQRETEERTKAFTGRRSSKHGTP